MKKKWLAVMLCLLMPMSCGLVRAAAAIPSQTIADVGDGSNGTDTDGDTDGDKTQPSISGLVDEMESRISRNNKKVRKARQELQSASETERPKIRKKMSKARSDFDEDIAALVTQILDLIESNPQGDDAIEGLETIFDSTRDYKIIDQATTVLEKRFLDSDQIGGLLNGVAEASSGKSVSLLKKLSERSPHKSVRASAALRLLQLYESARQQREWAGYYSGTNFPEFVQTFDHTKYDMLALYKTLIEKHGDVEIDHRQGKAKIADLVEPTVYRLEYLTVGKNAPETEGLDLDGESFKLSDYRGKVVLLDFWGDW